jgi:hypothetical protein
MTKVYEAFKQLGMSVHKSDISVLASVVVVLVKGKGASPEGPAEAHPAMCVLFNPGMSDLCKVNPGIPELLQQSLSRAGAYVAEGPKQENSFVWLECAPDGAEDDLDIN